MLGGSLALPENRRAQLRLRAHSPKALYAMDDVLWQKLTTFCQVLHMQSGEGPVQLTRCPPPIARPFGLVQAATEFARFRALAGFDLLFGAQLQIDIFVRRGISR